jgi:hypothetical protein
MKMVLCLLATCIVAQPLAQADSQEDATVKNLMDKCTSTNEVENAFCVGFIGGTGDMMQLVANSLKGNDRMALGMCARPRPSYESMKDEFVSWAQKHSEELSKPMRAGVQLALASTWRCNPAR